MTTIKDIAEYAGVSATTVSNVIHGKKNRVSQETVDRIQNAIKELNYVPNMFARSLVSNSSKVIAFINLVPTRADSTFSDDTFQMSFLSTIESVLRTNGYYLMFRRVETTDELQMFLQNWNVDGIFVGGTCSQEFAGIISELTMPTIVFDSPTEIKNTYLVGLDDENGCYISTKYLIDRGHRKIAFTSSTMHDGYVMQLRFAGYKRALAEKGINFDSSLVFESDVDLASSFKLADILAKIPGLTGVVSTTDIMAAGIITRFNEIGVRVPEDISVIGFDDISLCQMTVPPLTTIRQDVCARGKVAAENMMKILRGDTGIEKKIVLPVELIERKSVCSKLA